MTFKNEAMFNQFLPTLSVYVPSLQREFSPQTEWGFSLENT